MKGDEDNGENRRILYGDKFFPEITEAEKSGEKRFNTIFLGDKFQNAVLEVRKKKLNMSENCFVDDRHLEKWYLRNKSFVDRKMGKILPSFLKGQDLPNNSWWQRKITDYILFNGAKLIFSPLSSAQLPFIEAIKKKSGKGAYTDIRIFPYAIQSDITNFVKNPNNWRIIKPYYENKLTNKRIRGGEEKRQLQVLVDHFWSRNKEELKKEYSTILDPKDNSISIIVSKLIHHITGNKITPGNTKNIYFRSRRK